MRGAGTSILLAMAMLLFVGCGKGEGRTCYSIKECNDGLICVGDDVRRCEDCAKSTACKSDGRCAARGNECVK